MISGSQTKTALYANQKVLYSLVKMRRRRDLRPTEPEEVLVRGWETAAGKLRQKR